MRRNNRGNSILRDYLGDDHGGGGDQHSYPATTPYDYQPSSGSPLHSAQSTPERKSSTAMRLNGSSMDSRVSSHRNRPDHAATAHSTSFGSQPRGSRDSSSTRRRKVELVHDYSIDDEVSVTDERFQYPPSHAAPAPTAPTNERTLATPPRVSDRVSQILAPLTETTPKSSAHVGSSSTVAVSPFSPHLHRKRRRNEGADTTRPPSPHAIDWKDQSMKNLSLCPCRKVSVVVTVGESLASVANASDNHATPRHSNESNQICVFPSMENDDTAQSDVWHGDVASTVLDARAMVVVNPTAFGKHVPVSVTMDTARLVTQIAKLSSDDWARTYRFQQVLWSNSAANRRGKMEALYNMCCAIVNDLMAPGSIAHRILIGTATGTNAVALQTCQLFGTVGQQSIASVFSESNGDMSVEYILGRFGLVGLTVHGILKRIGASNMSSASWICTLSVLEVSGEDVLYDLLASKPFAVKGGTEVKFKYEDNGAAITGLSETPVDSLKSVGHLIRRAFAAALHKNRRSGRGHIIVTVNVFHKLNPTKRTSCQFIDLVAIELGEDGVTARRNSVKRKSLSALGAVLRGTLLKEAGNDTPVSYRESLLTKVIQRTMVQTDTRIVLLSTVSPDTDQYNNTMATIRYLDQLLHRPGQFGSSPFGAVDRRNQSSVLSPTSPGAKDVLNLSIDQFADEEKGVLLRELVSDPRQRLARVMLPPQSPEIGTQQIEKYTPTKYMNPYTSNQNHKAALRDQGSILSASPRESEILADIAEHWTPDDAALPTPITRNVSGHDVDDSLLLPSNELHVLSENDEDLFAYHSAAEMSHHEPNRSHGDPYPSTVGQPLHLNGAVQSHIEDFRSEVGDIENPAPPAESRHQSGDHVINDNGHVAFSSRNQVVARPEIEAYGNQLHLNSDSRETGVVASNDHSFDRSQEANRNTPIGVVGSGAQDVPDSETNRVLQNLEQPSARVWEYDDISHLSQPSKSDETDDAAIMNEASVGDELERILRENSVADDIDAYYEERSVELQSIDKSIESLLREPDFETTTDEALVDFDMFDERSEGLSAKAGNSTNAYISEDNALKDTTIERSMFPDALIDRTIPPPSKSRIENKDEAFGETQLSRRNCEVGERLQSAFEEKPRQPLIHESGLESLKQGSTSFQSAAGAYATPELHMDETIPLTTYDLPPDSPPSSPIRPTHMHVDQNRNAPNAAALNTTTILTRQASVEPGVDGVLDTLSNSEEGALVYNKSRINEHLLLEVPRSQLGDDQNGRFGLPQAVSREEETIAFESSRMNYEGLAGESVSSRPSWYDSQPIAPTPFDAQDGGNNHSVDTGHPLFSDHHSSSTYQSSRPVTSNGDISFSSAMTTRLPRPTANQTAPKYSSQLSDPIISHDEDVSPNSTSNDSRLPLPTANRTGPVIFPGSNYQGTMYHRHDDSGYDLPDDASNNYRLSVSSANGSMRSNLRMVSHGNDNLSRAVSNSSSRSMQSTKQTDASIFPGIANSSGTYGEVSQAMPNNGLLPPSVTRPGTSFDEDAVSNQSRPMMQSASRTEMDVPPPSSPTVSLHEGDGQSANRWPSESRLPPIQDANPSGAAVLAQSYFPEDSHDEVQLNTTSSKTFLLRPSVNGTRTVLPPKPVHDENGLINVSSSGGGIPILPTNRNAPSTYLNPNVTPETPYVEDDQPNTTAAIATILPVNDARNRIPHPNQFFQRPLEMPDVVSRESDSFPQRAPVQDTLRSNSLGYQAVYNVVRPTVFSSSESTVLDEIDQLQADVDKVKQTNLSVWQSSLASFDNLRHFLNSQKAAIAQLVFERDKALEEVRRLEHELKRQSESHTQSTIQLEREIDALQTEMKAMKLDRMEVVKIAEEAIATQAELEQRVTELDEELSLVALNTIPRTEHHALTLQNRSLEQEINNLKQDAGWYDEELACRNAMIAELQEVTKKLESDVRQHRGDLSQREMETESLKKALGDARGAEVEASALRAENANLRAEIQSVQSARREKEAEILREQQVRVDLAEKRRLDAEVTAAELLALQETLKSETTEQRAEIQDLQDELERLQQENTKFPSQLQDAELELGEHQRARSELQRELDQTRTSLESRIADVQKLMTNLTQLVADKEKDQHKIVKMERALSSFQDETRSRVEKVVHHRNEAALLLEKTVEENKALLETNQRLQSALMDAHSQVNDTKMSDPNTGHAQQFDIVTTENQKLRDEVERLRRQIGRVDLGGSNEAYRLSMLEERSDRDPQRREHVFSARDTARGRPSRLPTELDAYDRQDHLGGYHQASSHLLDLQRVEELAADVAFAAKARLEMGSIETSQIKEKLFALEDAKDEEINSLKSRIKSLERQTMARSRGL